MEAFHLSFFLDDGTMAVENLDLGVTPVQSCRKVRISCDAGSLSQPGTRPFCVCGSKLEVKPLPVVPRLVGGLESNGGGVDVE